LPPTIFCTIEGRAHTPSALIELRTFDWREMHEGCLVPSSSYLELTTIRAVGRYNRERRDAWRNLGSVRYHPAGNEFHCRWYEDRQVALLCAFNPADAVGVDVDIDQQYLSQTHDLQNPHLLNLLARTQQEIANPGLVSEVVLESLSSAILAAWKNQFFPILDFPAQRLRGEKLTQTDTATIVNKIRTERCAPTISELASSMGLSVRHFNRLFSQTTGETITAVFKRERINRAKDLLADPTLLVKEVAFLCGFESSAAFCKSFRASVGISPQAYRLLPVKKRASLSI
jgi:AraC family transcriptional regulator